jgi:GGDEF domain-containing protein
VHAHGFLDFLRDLFKGGNASTGPAELFSDKDPSLSEVAQHAEQVRDLIDRLRAQDADSVVAGCVQVLGLQQLKDRLGDSWGKLSDRALAIASEALDRNLGGGDIYRMVSDSAFQICFQSRDEAAAKALVARIAADIEARAAAELADAGGELSVDSFVASVPSARIQDAKDPLSALYANLLNIRDAVNRGVSRRHSLPALQYAGALFQPIWSNRDFGHTKNRCLLDTLAGAAAAKQLEQIEELDDLIEALANLDCVLFAKSIEGLHYALGDIKQATIILPVHFQTLALRQPEFLEIAATLPLPYRRFVLLDLIGVPTAASDRDLLAALVTGRSITDRIVLQMSPTDRRMNDAVRKLIWGASTNLGELDHEDPLVAGELIRFAQLCAEQGLHSFAYGANTIGKATAVVDAGFDYVAGNAVAPTNPAPRSHARFTPLFGDLVPRSSGLDRQVGLREHPRFAPLDPNSTVTLPSSVRHACRIPNVSASGAVVLCSIDVKVGDYLVVGSIPAKVVRSTKEGFAVRFLEVQQPSAVEIALQTPIEGDKLLQSLRLLTT